MDAHQSRIDKNHQLAFVGEINGNEVSKILRRTNGRFNAVLWIVFAQQLEKHNLHS